MRLGPNSIITEATMIETIPKAATHAETYLRTVSRGIVEHEPPVTLHLEEEVKGPGGLNLRDCLIATPTEKRLRYFQMVHFAKPMGGALQMGFYLLGGERLVPGGEVRALLNAGMAKDAEIDAVVSVVSIIRDYAVAPAIQYIADLVQGGDSGAQRQGGFLGL